MIFTSPCDLAAFNCFDNLALRFTFKTLSEILTGRQSRIVKGDFHELA